MNNFFKFILYYLFKKNIIFNFQKEFQKKEEEKAEGEIKNMLQKSPSDNENQKQNININNFDEWLEIYKKLRLEVINERMKFEKEIL